MSTLFGRSWKVQVDDLDLSALDIEFKILSSLKATPNKCALTLYNVNGDHRAQFLKRNKPSPGSKLVGVPMQLEAGYTDNTSVLFSGDLREVASTHESTDWKTTLAGDDGGRAYREARINQTFTKGTPISNILDQVASALGLGRGNTADFEAGAEIAGVGTTLPHTMTISGSAAKGLTRLLASMDLTWSIQRGALQLLQKGKPLNLGAIRLSPDTGLIESPESSIDATVSLGNPQQFAAGAKETVAKAPKPKDPSIVKLKTLLIPGLVPGRKIDLQSNSFKGGYMLTECEYVGKSWAKEWYVNSIARLYT